MLASYLHILRVFGLPSTQITTILRELRAEGCAGLRLLERDGEFAVCVQASAPTRAMARDYAKKWIQKLRARLGDALYAEGEVSLAQATLQILLEKRRLVVAADETTGRLIGDALRELPHSEAVFDFGHETYGDPQKARQLVTPRAILEKFPGDLLQAAAGRAQAAMTVAGADLAVVYMPASVGQPPFALLCDKRGAVVRTLEPDLNDAATANHLLDLLRRRVQGLGLGAATVAFRPGRDKPDLTQEGEEKKGDTTKFSLRRARPRTTGPDYEPMLDFDTATLGEDTLLSGVAAQAAEPGAAPEPPQPDLPLAPPLELKDLPEPLPAEKEAEAEPTVFVPAGRLTGAITFDEEPAPAPAQRRIRVMQPVPHQQSDVQPAPPPAEEPSAPAEAAPAPTIAPEVELALGLYPEDRGEPAHSILDEELPDFLTQTPPPAPPVQEQDAVAALPEAQQAAIHLYGELPDEEPDEELGEEPVEEPKEAPAPAPESNAASLRSRSLAIVEKSERRRQRMVVLVLLLLLLILATGVFSLWYFFKGKPAAEPDPRAYGTTMYDEQATQYLAEVREAKPDVVGYVAFPGQEGALLYNSADVLGGTVGARQAAVHGQSYIGSTTAGHTTFDWSADLAALTEIEALRDNSGFTLYLPEGIYRYKVMAVYYADPTESGAGAFDPTAYGDLSGYYNYVNFVVGVQVRSLFQTGVQPGAGSSFVTLSAPDTVGGGLVCVTGRLIRPTESAQLSAAAVQAAQSPLLTAARYAAAGQPMPNVQALLKEGLAAFAADRSTLEEAGSSITQQSSNNDVEAYNELFETVKEMTGTVLANTDQLIGLTDWDAVNNSSATESGVGGSGGAGGEGEEGGPPAQQAPVPTAAPSQTPTAAPTAVPTPAPGSSATPAPAATTQPTAAPTAAPTQAPAEPAAETINVTMNGTAQTMDLVQCLAMIAQNELGANAPAEAYKAQCVAAHCWILNEGSYPSVTGQQPGAAALAAAKEVANVLVTFNGKVAWTPYFASASTGTASSADVWGGARAWLQAVDSPYDAQVATNWHTSGDTSNTARFAAQTVQARILDKLGIDLSGVDKNEWFKIVSTNQYGWVTSIQIGPDNGEHTTRTGVYFRETLLARQSVGGSSLRSQCFTVRYDEALDCFIFDVYGYGHGCGMSQWGAIGYAKNGWTYEQILTHYYVGTTLITY